MIATGYEWRKQDLGWIEDPSVSSIACRLSRHDTTNLQHLCYALLDALETRFFHSRSHCFLYINRALTCISFKYRFLHGCSH